MPHVRGGSTTCSDEGGDPGGKAEQPSLWAGQDPFLNGVTMLRHVCIRHSESPNRQALTDGSRNVHTRAHPEIFLTKPQRHRSRGAAGTPARVPREETQMRAGGWRPAAEGPRRGSVPDTAQRHLGLFKLRRTSCERSTRNPDLSVSAPRWVYGAMWLRGPTADTNHLHSGISHHRV